MSEFWDADNSISIEGNCSLTITSSTAGGGLLDFAGYANVRSVRVSESVDMFLSIAC